MPDLLSLTQSLFPDEAGVFWAASSAVLTAINAYITFLPIIEKRKLGETLFGVAVQVDVSLHGVFSIQNIYEKPIIIEKIEQSLIQGQADLGLAPISPIGLIAQALKKIPSVKSDKIKVRKRLAPHTAFIFAGTKTHLPKAMESEAIWIVKTKIRYTSTKGVKGTANFMHRFSVTLEPTKMWVEIV